MLKRAMASIHFRPGCFWLQAGLVGMSLLLWGCVPPPPPPSAPPTSGTGGTFTVTVSTVGPPTWTYSVTTNGSTNIVKIEFISSINQTQCTFAVPQGWSAVTSAGSTVIGDPRLIGLVTASFSVTCDFQNGPVYLKVTDLGGGTSTVGPIAGPV